MNKSEELLAAAMAVEMHYAQRPKHVWFTDHDDNSLKLARHYLATIQPGDPPPINMILPCPRCGMLHIDAPEPATGWTNPPHKSHLCHGCGLIWRPADVPTNGVPDVMTRGEKDSPPVGEGPLTKEWLLEIGGELDPVATEPACYLFHGKYFSLFIAPEDGSVALIKRFGEHESFPLHGVTCKTRHQFRRLLVLLRNDE